MLVLDPAVDQSAGDERERRFGQVGQVVGVEVEVPEVKAGVLV
ncbi:hypothetical protein ACR6C2_36235 [Streptomyces sp. INA 01156]